MGLRHGSLVSLGLLVLAASAGAETSPRASDPSAAQRAKPASVSGATTPGVKLAQASPAAARPSTPPVPASGAPRTLAEALAATYSNQPALQAERAKLRATDENGPSALAGWRPTVVLAGTAGYGDGLTRSFSFATQPGRYIKTPSQREIGTAQATVNPGRRHKSGRAGSKIQSQGRPSGIVLDFAPVIIAAARIEIQKFRGDPSARARNAASKASNANSPQNKSLPTLAAWSV